jgi:parvulin-like peptidyl-prolyl isomerase
MKRKTWLIATIAAVILLLAFFVFPSSKSESSEISVTVQKGPFDV